MHISRFRLKNYSSFSDSEWVQLSPKLNVVVGLNNSGKSALLAALTPNLPAIQHRNEKQYLPGDLQKAVAELDLSTSTGEIRQRLIKTGLTVRTTVGGPSVGDHNHLRQLLERDTQLTIKTRCTGGESISFREPTFGDATSFERPHIAQFNIEGGELKIANAGAGVDDSLMRVFAEGDDPNFFYFTPQRYSVSSTGFASAKRLSSEATNLPALLAHLLGNYPSVYREIEARLREIIPSIGSITVSTEEGNLKILVWPATGPQVRELAFDLAHSGTGVSQVISILTAVVTSDSSVVVIDEINSFLHPAATKQLLRILTAFYPQHQYVLSSHSSEVMSFPLIDNLLMVDKAGFTSSVRVIDRSNLADTRSAFQHIGISMTDVLGADRILWVEGATEELVFPDILRRAALEVDGSYRFAAVAATGDFAKRGSSKKAVINLYSRATTAAAPLVEGSSFILDRETLSDEAVEQISRQTDHRLILLPRRCLESYALSPAAIARLLNSELTDLQISTEEVAAEIEKLAQDRTFGAVMKWKGRLTDVDWLKSVDAANIIAKATSNLTNQRLSFQKTIHTPRLIADIPLDDLEELIQSIKTAMDAAGLTYRDAH